MSQGNEGFFTKAEMLLQTDYEVVQRKLDDFIQVAVAPKGEIQMVWIEDMLTAIASC